MVARSVYIPSRPGDGNSPGHGLVRGTANRHLAF